MVTYMPYTGVMWVTLPVTCEREKRPAQTLWMLRQKTNYSLHIPFYTSTHTYKHIHPCTQQTLYTQHIPAGGLLYIARPDLGALKMVFVYSGEG